jgi:hypothetical protein
MRPEFKNLADAGKARIMAGEAKKEVYTDLVRKCPTDRDRKALAMKIRALPNPDQAGRSKWLSRTCATVAFLQSITLITAVLEASFPAKGVVLVLAKTVIVAFGIGYAHLGFSLARRRDRSSYTTLICYLWVAMSTTILMPLLSHEAQVLGVGYFAGGLTLAYIARRKFFWSPQFSGADLSTNGLQAGRTPT